MGKGGGAPEHSIDLETVYGVQINAWGGFDLRHMLATLEEVGNGTFQPREESLFARAANKLLAPKDLPKGKGKGKKGTKAKKQQVDWSKKTVKELKQELAQRGLPTTGVKSKLVAALESFIEAGLDELPPGVAARAQEKAMPKVSLLLPEGGQPDEDEMDESMMGYKTDRMEAVEKAFPKAAKAIGCPEIALEIKTGSPDIDFGAPPFDKWETDPVSFWLVAKPLSTKHSSSNSFNSGWGVASTMIKFPTAAEEDELEEKILKVLDTFGLEMASDIGLHMVSEASDFGFM